jgi:hypothetical protein
LLAAVVETSYIEVGAGMVAPIKKPPVGG